MGRKKEDKIQSSFPTSFTLFPCSQLASVAAKATLRQVLCTYYPAILAENIVHIS